MSEATELSVAQVRAACAAGRVSVVGDGRATCPVDAQELVFPEDTVLLDGRRVCPSGVHHHAMLHKPSGVISTARDPDGGPDLAPWLRQMRAGMFPVGRLDRDTTGLMLFSTDGDLQQAVLRPEQHTPKSYWLWLDEVVLDNDPRLSRLVEGIQLAGDILRADAAQVQSRTRDFTELEVTLTQGANRQLRRMCWALRLRLVHLHRKSIGPLLLGDLPSGEWRSLTDCEVSQLWAALGGPDGQHREKVAALARQAEHARAAGRPLPRLEAWLARHT